VGVVLCKIAGVIIINISSMILLKICELGWLVINNNSHNSTFEPTILLKKLPGNLIKQIFNLLLILI